MDHHIVTFAPKKAVGVRSSEKPLETVAPSQYSTQVNGPDDLRVISPENLIRLFNHLTDGDKIKALDDDTVPRTWALLQNPPVIEMKQAFDLPEGSIQPIQPDEGVTEEADMAVKKSKASKVKKKKVAKVKKTAAHPPKPVAEMRQVRAGTIRAKILKLADGTRTNAAIAKACDITEQNLVGHAYCLHRDCGLGYSLEDGKLLILYPGSRTIEDAIKQNA